MCFLHIKAMEVASSWDSDGDGLIENGGFPDQTYDTWMMTGASAYCGGLWLAALSCMAEMASKMASDGGAAEAEKWTEMLERAKKSYVEKLWDEEEGFFRFDATARGSKTVMSDQLCGHWYLKMIGQEEGKEGRHRDVFDQDKVRRALKTVYENNVIKFADGKLGAVNG